MSDWEKKLNDLHKELKGGYVEDKIVELEYSLFEFEKRVRADAIEEFINSITESRYARIWCCVDSQMESCSAKECAECLKHFKDILLEIAEQLKQT